MVDDELLDDFYEESIDLIEKVKSALEMWDDTPDKVDAIDSIYRWVHTIKGGCAIFEYDATASIAHELETFLGKLKSKSDNISAKELQMLQDGIDAIESSFHDGGKSFDQNSFELIEAEQTEGDDLSVGDEELVTAHFWEWFEENKGLVEDLRQAGYSFFELKISTAFSQKIMDKLGEKKIMALHSQESDGDLAALFALDQSMAQGPMLELANILMEKYEGRWCFAKKMLEKSPIEQEVKNEVKKSVQQGQEVLRVPLPTVNSILDHVLELFLVRNQLAHLFQEHKSIFKDHHSFIQQFESLDNVIERNIHELESKTMSMRLSPIKKIFDRMDRVVSEYCKQSNKQIEFHTNGQGIDLDKKVLDQLNEPLIHLIRNAIDHGIESSEDRVSSGKSAQGRVELSAQVLGNEVAIVIKDDGKGIDPKKIYESAKSKGLAVDHLQNDKEIIELIFAPGFSTAQEVTDVSGRGVGMDAVRHSIAELGGSIGIESVPGQGSEFRIKLPLTMSVSKCLIVEVEGLNYAFSTKSIVFVEKVRPHSLKRNGAAMYYDFNGKLIPCFDISKIVPSYRAEPGLPKTHIYVCVTSLGGNETAFCVDNVVQTLSIVLKPLPKSSGKHPLIAGVSILPAGNPIFVLNAQECIKSLMDDQDEGEGHVAKAA